MISVITFNPSIDRLYKVDDFQVGSVQRANHVNPTAGGKGLNVAKVLKKLGTTPTCLGFLGGYNGKYIEDEIENIGLKNEFTNIDEETRICLNIMDSNGTSTEILEKGPSVKEEDIKEFEKKLGKILKNTKVLVASGSLLQGLPENYYKNIANICEQKNIKLILDTSGKHLESVLDSCIYLIKPNIDELEYLSKTKITNKEDAIIAGRQLLEKYSGIKNICISMGKEGMILLNEENVYEAQIPSVKVLNPVGSGDSSIAGFAYATLNNSDLIQCLKLSNACGISNAMSIETGTIDISDVSRLVEEINVKKYVNDYLL